MASHVRIERVETPSLGNRSYDIVKSDLPRAVHIPLHELGSRLDEVPSGEELCVHCGGGLRAAIASSLLERAGRRVVLIDDAFDNAEDKGNPLVRPTADAGAR